MPEVASYGKGRSYGVGTCSIRRYEVTRLEIDCTGCGLELEASLL